MSVTLIRSNKHIPAPVAMGPQRWVLGLVALLLWAGVLLDVWTTATESRGRGLRHYEANPLGYFLLTHVGWWGVAGVLSVCVLGVVTGLGCACCRYPRLCTWGVKLVLLLAIMRWIVVATSQIQ